MILGFQGKYITMNLSNFDDVIVRGVPHRFYDTAQKTWMAPPTPKVVQYLTQFTAREQHEVLNKAEAHIRGQHRLISIEGYQFKTQPYKHQSESLRRMSGMAAFALFLEPGLGKSKVLIDDSCLAFQHGFINAQAAVCPNSIKSNWADEIEIHSPLPTERFVYSPSRKKQAKDFIYAEYPGRVKWFIIGVESLSSGDGAAFLEEFLRHHSKIGPGAGLFIDESSRIKTHSAARTKKLIKLGPLSPRRRIATGTPITKGLQDAWSQFAFLDPAIITMNFFAYRNTYCQMGGYLGKQVIGSKNEDYFVDLTAPYVMLGRKADCLDLPEKIYQVRHVQPTEAMVKAYRELKKTGMTQIGDEVVSFANVLVQQLRLHELTGGFATVEKDTEMLEALRAQGPAPEFFGEAIRNDFEDLISRTDDMIATLRASMDKRFRRVPLEGGNPKIEELIAIAEETPGKMIIWCRYKSEIAAVCEALRGLNDGEVVEFHGDVKEDARTAARRRFQDDEKVRFFVGQIQTGGIGITLTRGTTVVYFSNDWSLENRIQSEDRAHRIGQDKNVLYIDLVMDPPEGPRGGKEVWVDGKVRLALAAGKSYADDLMIQIREATVNE